MKEWLVYLAECADSSYYTGISNDVEKRIKLHNSGKGASYTKGRRPVKLVYSEVVGIYSDALKREIEIKKMRRKEKINLIKY